MRSYSWGIRSTPTNPFDTLQFIEERRGAESPPGEVVADFEEYARIYHDAWADPAIRWLLSTVPSAMIFDDHEVGDDWNISEAWVEEMRQKPNWNYQISGGYASYWLYQHLGNLSPEELDRDDLYKRVRDADDAWPVLRDFAYRAHRGPDGTRWRYHRDFGNTRLLMMDARGGRVLEEDRRSMVDEEEWAWIVEMAMGNFDHPLLGTSLPLLLGPTMHHLQSWDEKLCSGTWGARAARWAEGFRRSEDLDHWASFHDSFAAMVGLIQRIASGDTGTPPSTILILSGDVHHGYLAEMDLGDGVQSAAYQAVCSPLRNPLGVPERLALSAGWTRNGERMGKTLARLAGVEEPPVRWRLTHEEPWFENHVSTLQLRGREAFLKVEKTTPEDVEEPRLHKILEHRLA